MAKTLRLLVVIAASLVLFLWRTSAILQPETGAARMDLAEGDRICPQMFGGVQESGHDFFLVATDSRCPYCELTKPFEIALAEYGESAGVPTTYLLTEGPAGEPLAERYHAAGKSVLRANSSDLGIRMNPTFVRLSAAGVVKAIWIGGFRGESRRQLAWDFLTQAKHTRLENAAYEEIEAAAEKPATIVGFSRSVLVKFPGARVVDETKFLAQEANELEGRRGVILDCRSASAPVVCQLIARALIQRGQPDVKAIGLPSRQSVCAQSFQIETAAPRRDVPPETKRR